MTIYNVDSAGEWSHIEESDWIPVCNSVDWNNRLTDNGFSAVLKVRAGHELCPDLELTMWTRDTNRHCAFIELWNEECGVVGLVFDSLKVAFATLNTFLPVIRAASACNVETEIRNAIEGCLMKPDTMQDKFFNLFRDIDR